MKNLTSNEIRTLWLSFFKSKEHTVIDGASLIPHNDKTLLWINSGVAALKQYFDGSKVSHDRRLVNVQKSIRTNDIENVGKTNRHHTFFEMLGNFSIGDYFRKEAITWGYEFLTSEKWLGLPKAKLFFTYHPSDLETRDFWIKCGIDATHVIANADNYWEIGEGPCGPNTEIFFDLGEELDPTNTGVALLSSDVDNDRFLEIWNIVFSQYNAKSGVKREDYEELPSKNIDTGAGLERIASVMQQTESNFETDLFLPILEEIAKLSRKQYVDNKEAFRVIADHLRTSVFALSDGASFANEGRGYVLRRLLRRAVRYGKKLGIHGAFLYKLAPTVVTIMADFYPYLKSKETHVINQIKAEELRFLYTLSHGEELLRNALREKKALAGEIVFKLYDTFGFPLEITEEIATEVGGKIDKARFFELLEAQRERARAARKNISSMGLQSADLLAFTTKTDFNEKSYELKSEVVALFKDGVSVNESDGEVSAIFKVTPFYSESGGQVSDLGTIFNKTMQADVHAMSKAPHGQHLHHLHLNYGTLKVGDKVTLAIDERHRRLVTLNHSATHFLHRALNDVLGNDVSQAGSYVGPDYLRFDFNYNQKLTDHELARIETLVNEYISAAIPLTIKFMSVEEAKALGAKALFMEKYGDLVRVVMFSDISIELCGGTHVNNSSEIGTFVITSEGSVASGVRRIVALSGFTAYEYLKNYMLTVNHVLNSLKVSERKELIPALRALISRSHDLEALNKAHAKEKLQALATTLKPKVINDKNVYLAILHDQSRDDLALISDDIRSRDQQAVIVLLNEKALLVSVSKHLSLTTSADKIVKTLTKAYGGRGGGRSDFANGVIERLSSPEEILKLLQDELRG